MHWLRENLERMPIGRCRCEQISCVSVSREKQYAAGGMTCLESNSQIDPIHVWKLHIQDCDGRLPFSDYFGSLFSRIRYPRFIAVIGKYCL